MVALVAMVMIGRDALLCFQLILKIIFLMVLRGSLENIARRDMI